MASETNITFESVKERLDEIVDAVNDESISLDDALDLYEEAVKLGVQASTLLEEGIAAMDGEVEGESADGVADDAALDAVQDTADGGSASAAADEQAGDAVSQL